jgi:hypothetical protein
MTRADIRRRILRALREDPDTPSAWSVDELNDMIDEGQEFLAETALQLVRTFHIPRLSGTMFYALHACGERILAPFRVWLPDESRRLAAWSLTDLDARHEQWMTVQGDPWVWFPVDWDTIGIWPAPSTGGGWLEISAYVWPEPLLEDRNTPEFLPADHEALVYYGELMAYLKQHDAQRASDRAIQFLQRWGGARERGSIEQLQSALHARGKADDDHRYPPG